MFRNYIISNLRYFRNNKLFTFINVFGLAIGMSASVGIFCIIHYHHSFDKFEPGNRFIYRLVSQIKLPGATFLNWGVSYPIATAARDRVPGIRDVVTIVQYGYNNKVAVRLDDEKTPRMYFRQQGVAFVDSSFFLTIPYQWLAGSPAYALRPAFSAVLTESRARLYFPRLIYNDIIGRSLAVNDSLHFTVTGIVRDLDHPSDFGNDVFLSRSSLRSGNFSASLGLDDWSDISSNIQCLVVLDTKTLPDAVEKGLDDMQKSHQFTPGDTTGFMLQPLSDVHFNESLGGKVHQSTLNGLALIAIFLLSIACINFVNLSTAAMTHRQTEAGIRKLLGAGNPDVIARYLTGTFLLSLLSIIIAIALSPFLLRPFKEFLPPGLSLTRAGLGAIALFALGVVVVVSLLSGLYPAWLLARLPTVSVLKGYTKGLSIGKGSIRNGQGSIRKILTVFQFVIAEVLIVATFVVARQIHFSLHRDPGFRKSAVIDIPLPEGNGDAFNKRFYLASLLRKIPQLELVSLGAMAPVAEGSAAGSFLYTDNHHSIETLAEIRTGDSAYVKVFGLKLLAGIAPRGDSSHALLIDESFARSLGFKSPALAVNHYLETQDKNKWLITGVLADFATGRESNGIAPAVYYPDVKSSRYLHVLLKPDDPSGSLWKKAIGNIQTGYNEAYPGQEFSYRFFDDEVGNLFYEDRNLFTLLIWSSAVAITVGCLGLLGLAIFIANRKAKEIAIRKVLGSTVTRIVLLVSGGFIRLILLGFIISIPITWWWANRWLQAFAHKATLNWWLFTTGGIIMGGLAILTLSVVAGLSARANPATSLRAE